MTTPTSLVDKDTIREERKIIQIAEVGKDVGMACQKVCKQGRGDIIVKVNLQSPIPTSFTLQLQTNVKTMQG